jgi:hypothetical protein
MEIEFDRLWRKCEPHLRGDRSEALAEYRACIEAGMSNRDLQDVDCFFSDLMLAEEIAATRNEWLNHTGGPLEQQRSRKPERLSAEAGLTTR